MAMPAALDEISGIAFNNGISDTIYAQQDEHGKLFHFKWQDKNVLVTKFGPKGDYEDLAICKNYVIMLRSDGVLFVFPLSDARKQKSERVRIWDRFLPAGEYEAMSADEKNGKIFVLCKNCEADKTNKKSSGFIFSISDDGSLSPSGNFQINVKQIQSGLGRAKIRFRPSGMAADPVTHNWLIISSVNKLLVILDPDWKVTNIYDLNPAIFVQPEGIAIDKDRHLFIANERNYTSHGTILRFNYKP
ncbi:MAG: SdiA-regulated family protein [Bacteroidetes bacterium]|nr:MAG: SdiA-regulated family protein [Bacteroidota bacterium]